MSRSNALISQIDKIIGAKICALRLSQGLSRQELSKLIDVTHQQTHKYEKGINRISVGRLLLIANALNKPLHFFFQDLPLSLSIESPHEEEAQRMCLELMRHFVKISDDTQRSAINHIVRCMASNDNHSNDNQPETKEESTM